MAFEESKRSLNGIGDGSGMPRRRRRLIWRRRKPENKGLSIGIASQYVR
ncbi:hypothetical protein RSSM_01894 [Rhodopirellula sallentina SM41]|uniref:Uncharacterized protein n=1 Tax=Rhodopirellula sallentina SM41 TaxID=1263870 RepID=M5U5B6_9BACT|nr:hypothetical protein RSSM_01894 [Rhodopirellula sallentina SM41]